MGSVFQVQNICLSAAAAAMRSHDATASDRLLVSSLIRHQPINPRDETDDSGAWPQARGKSSNTCNARECHFHRFTHLQLTITPSSVCARLPAPLHKQRRCRHRPVSRTTQTENRGVTVTRGHIRVLQKLLRLHTATLRQRRPRRIAAMAARACWQKRGF